MSHVAATEVHAVGALIWVADDSAVVSGAILGTLKLEALCTRVGSDEIAGVPCICCPDYAEPFHAHSDVIHSYACN